ncbi:A24 family peptidase [Paenibacillus bovis]|nr:A24 family peptidase [Paenibacillus bovis]
MESMFIGGGIFVLWAFWTDIRARKIPNFLNILFMISGLAYHLASERWEGLLFAGKGFALGFGIMLLLYAFRAVGAGDVKLFGGIGAWFGIGMTAQILMYSIVFAGVIGLVIMLWRRETIVRMRRVLWKVTGALLWKQPLRATPEEQKQYLTFPFMAAVLPSVIFCYWYI